jgi:hypothetical protein
VQDKTSQFSEGNNKGKEKMCEGSCGAGGAVIRSGGDSGIIPLGK